MAVRTQVQPNQDIYHINDLLHPTNSTLTKTPLSLMHPPLPIITTKTPSTTRAISKVPSHSGSRVDPTVAAWLIHTQGHLLTPNPSTILFIPRLCTPRPRRRVRISASNRLRRTILLISLSLENCFLCVYIRLLYLFLLPYFSLFFLQSVRFIKSFRGITHS